MATYSGLTVDKVYCGNILLLYDDTPVPSNDKILYTSTDGNIVIPYRTGSTYYGANIVSNTYTSGQGCILFDNNLTFIGELCFANRTLLSTITLPNTVTSIEQGAFGNCTSLSAITLPSSLTYIGQSVFAGCYSLNSITFPSTLTYISRYAFNNCTSLNTFNYNGTIAQWNNVYQDILWHDGVPATIIHCTDGDVAL